jgi:hypothetical protein
VTIPLRDAVERTLGALTAAPPRGATLSTCIECGQ